MLAQWPWAEENGKKRTRSLLLVKPGMTAVAAVRAVQGKETLESPPVARHDVWLARGFDGASSASFVLLNSTALEQNGE